MKRKSCVLSASAFVLAILILLVARFWGDRAHRSIRECQTAEADVAIRICMTNRFVRSVFDEAYDICSRIRAVEDPARRRAAALKYVRAVAAEDVQEPLKSVDARTQYDVLCNHWSYAVWSASAVGDITPSSPEAWDGMIESLALCRLAAERAEAQIGTEPKMRAHAKNLRMALSSRISQLSGIYASRRDDLPATTRTEILRKVQRAIGRLPQDMKMDAAGTVSVEKGGHRIERTIGNEFRLNGTPVTATGSEQK